MKKLLLALLSIASVAGCSAAPTTATTAGQIDTQYLYGTVAGTPQRPSLMN